MKNIVWILMLVALASCTGYMEEEIDAEVSSVKSRSAGTANDSNCWIIQNASMEGNMMFYDLIYSNTKQTYTCYSLYTLFLYKGAYDGRYGGYSISWNYDWRTESYHPETIPSEYGVVVCEWDECIENEGGAKSVSYKGTYSRRRGVQLAPGKTLDDIEYVLFFLYDNKNFSTLGGLDRYVDDCYDFYVE